MQSKYNCLFSSFITSDLNSETAGNNGRDHNFLTVGVLYTLGGARSLLPVVELVLLVLNLAHHWPGLTLLSASACAAHHSRTPVFPCFLYWVRDYLHAIALARVHLEVWNHVHGYLTIRHDWIATLTHRCSICAIVEVWETVLHLQTLTAHGLFSHHLLLLRHLL